MADTLRDDPYPAYNFAVQIDGIAVKGSFLEVSGIESEVVPIDYREGGSFAIRKLPGLHKNGNVTLKRGVIGDLSLWNWFKSGAQGKLARANVSITLLDEQRNPVCRWKLTNAWPCKYTGPLLNAKSSEVAIESVELVHEGLDIE
jgi:phage tail-like protein